MNPIVMALGAVLLALAFGAQMLRWLRVLQREHYDPKALFVFLGRWTAQPIGKAKASRFGQNKRPVTISHVCFVLLIIFILFRATGLIVVDAGVYGLFAPQGLSIKGRTSPLQWTRRLRVIAAVATVLAATLSILCAIAGWQLIGAVVVVWGVPQLLDITTRLLRPYEEHNAKKFVKLATQRLKRVAPIVVGITGSYGKTSTKNHLRELLERDGGIVATPKSFNNRAGLSRAINENLVDGTRVFIAEMGTYGPGEIADLCAWCPPSIAIVTAIGPVHLERMKSLETVEAAKFEITSRADIVILNIDDTRLANWPAKLGSKQVITAGSKNEDAFVRVIAGVEWSVIVGGDVVATFAPLSGVQPTNLACAIAASLQLGLTKDQIAQRINTVLPVANRANVVTAPSGVIIIDDTFNANPASASAALETLRTLPIAGRRVVMTPGLIELGKEQWTENVKLATHAAGINAELGIVGRTNALPLLAGAGNEAMRFDVREDAVNWVRANLAPGDAVLYLNDLPDHYL